MENTWSTSASAPVSTGATFDDRAASPIRGHRFAIDSAGWDEMSIQTPIASSVALLLVATAVPAEARLKKSQIDRLDNATQVMADAGSGFGTRAKCVAVIPSTKRLAFGFGAEYGKGALTCRNGDRWSSPVFIQLGRVSFGPQIGARLTDLVLLFKNEQGVKRLLEDKLTLGGDAAVAAGPIGRDVEAATDAQMRAGILAYSHAQGLFAGLAIVGGMLKPDPEANEDLYGRQIQAREILLGSNDGTTAVTQRMPGPAETFVRAVARAQGQPSLAERDAERARDVAHSVAPRRNDTDSEQASKQEVPDANEPGAADVDKREEAADVNKRQASDVDNVGRLLDQLEQTVKQLEREESDGGSAVGTAGTDSNSAESNHQREIRKLRRQIESLRDALENPKR